ncbi:MAG: hypothetical protein ACM34G_13405 [Acidobacteriota bacterium]
MKRADKIGYVVLGGVLAVLLAAGWFFGLRPHNGDVCDICQRQINPRARVTLEIGGKRKDACCARCAITEALQERRPVRLIRVTDYATGSALAPDQAWFVDGSRKVLCSHDQPMFDESKHAEHLAFDRCSPGAYAFARRQDAEAFVRENGGAILRLKQLMEGVPQ